MIEQNTQRPAALCVAIGVLVQLSVLTCQKRSGAVRIVDGNTAALFPGSRCPVGRGPCVSHNTMRQERIELPTLGL